MVYNAGVYPPFHSMKLHHFEQKVRVVASFANFLGRYSVSNSQRAWTRKVDAQCKEHIWLEFGGGTQGT